MSLTYLGQPLILTLHCFSSLLSCYFPCFEKIDILFICTHNLIGCMYQSGEATKMRDKRESYSKTSQRKKTLLFLAIDTNMIQAS